jgi:hypothetical protein
MMDAMRKIILQIVLAVTGHAARHPYSYVFGITLLSLALLGTGLATNFDMNVDAQSSYTPIQSVIWEERNWIEKESGFPRPPLSVRMMLHAQGETVLTKKSIYRSFEVLETVEKTPLYDTVCSSDSEKHHYRSQGVVGGYYSECRIRGVTLLWNNSLSTMEGEIFSDDDAVLAMSMKKYPDGSDVDPREIMARSTKHNKKIVSAESFLMEFSIPGTHHKSTQLRDNVVNTMLRLRKRWAKAAASDPSHLKLELFTSDALEKETTRAVMKDIPLIPTVFVVMTVFTCVIFSSNNQRESSKHILLGIGAVICVVLSLACAYGLMFLCGRCSCRS